MLLLLSPGPLSFKNDGVKGLLLFIIYNAGPCISAVFIIEVYIYIYLYIHKIIVIIVLNYAIKIYHSGYSGVKMEMVALCKVRMQCFCTEYCC